MTNLLKKHPRWSFYVVLAIEILIVLAIIVWIFV